MNDFFDNQRILGIIWNRRIHFVIIGLLAIVLSAVFSSPFFITPKYKASARLYPVNLGVMSEESETEQMLEIMQSADLKFRMFDAFKLHEVYKVKPGDPNYNTFMLGIFNEHFAARKTEFETVEIEFLDIDPLRARQMCDSMISFYNQKVRSMHRSKHLEMVTILDHNLKLRKHERDSVMELLNRQRAEYHILDFNQQVAEVTRGYMRALSDGRDNTSGMREIRKLYENMVHKGAESHILENRFANLVQTIDSLKFLYDINLSESRKVITYAHVVEHPVVPDKKAYPVRWLIVAFSLVSALMAGLTVFMILDYKKQQ